MKSVICSNLTCGFRAQAENEHYRISVVATNTEGILEYWIIGGDQGCASSDEGHNVVPLRPWRCVDGSREAHILPRSLPLEDFEPYCTLLLSLFRSFSALLQNKGGGGWEEEWAAFQKRLLYRVDLHAGLFKLPPGGLTWNRTISSGFRDLPHSFSFIFMQS